MLGVSGVGKSSLIRTAADRVPSEGETPPPPPPPTVAPTRREFGVRLGGQEVRVETWDTSGQPRFRPLNLPFMAHAAACVLVFDVKSRESFRALGSALDDFARMTGKTPRSFPFVLVRHDCGPARRARHVRQTRGAAQGGARGCVGGARGCAPPRGTSAHSGGRIQNYVFCFLARLC